VVFDVTQGINTGFGKKVDFMRRRRRETVNADRLSIHMTIPSHAPPVFGIR
jgi:hypothetical protein